MVKISNKLIGSQRVLYEIKTSKNGKSYGVYTNKANAIKDAKILLNKGVNVGVFPVQLLPSKTGSVSFN